MITLADWRWARVAPEGAIAAAWLLEASRVFRLAGSDDPALRIVLDHAGATAVVTVCPRRSFPGVARLGVGGCWRCRCLPALTVPLFTCGVYDASFAAALLRGRGPVLLHLWRREQGLLVAPGNPGGVTGPADLGRLRVTKCEVGTGTGILLDQLLAGAGIALDKVVGPRARVHLEIALVVALGVTDVGLDVRGVGKDLGAALASRREWRARRRRSPLA